MYIGMRMIGMPELAMAPLIALALTDGFSSWPTFQDCMKGLQSSKLERASWCMTALSAVLGLAAVGNYWTVEMFIPGYLTLYMVAIAAASLFSKAAGDQHAHATPAE